MLKSVARSRLNASERVSRCLAEASSSTPTAPVIARPRARAALRAFRSSASKKSALTSKARLIASRSPASASSSVGSMLAGALRWSHAGSDSSQARTTSGVFGCESSPATAGGIRTDLKSAASTSIWPIHTSTLRGLASETTIIAPSQETASKATRGQLRDRRGRS